jgi:hypothetical protein
MHPIKNNKIIKVLLLTLFTFVLSTVQAQTQISFLAGYGTYSMNELKTFQKELQSQFPVEAKITDAFPGYLYYELTATTRLKSYFFCGISVSYGSTGGRIYYADYSGSMYADQRARYLTIGIPFGWNVPVQENKLKLIFQIKPAVYFGNLDVSIVSHLENQIPENEEFKFSSTNIGLQPSVQMDRRFGPLWLGIQMGYNVNVQSSNLFFKENKDYYLLNNKGDKIHANWSGLRFGVSLSYPLD